MARPPSIRITENDKLQYNKLVSYSKRKINRTKKNYGIDLSGEIRLPQLEDFSTRQEFNEWKEKQESFLNRNNQKYQFVKNEFGVVASKSEITKLELERAREKRLAEEHNKKFFGNKPTRLNGQELTQFEAKQLLMAKPNSNAINVPNDFDFSKVKTRQDLDRIKNQSKKRSNKKNFDRKMEIMKDNFIRSLEGSFNSLADELIAELETVPPDDFLQLFKQFPDDFDFELYDSDGQIIGADENNINRMLGYVKAYKQKTLDFDLWGF